MTSVATLQPDPAPILACTVSRDVQNFDILIDDMEAELGEAWGDLGFEDVLLFLEQPDAATLQFIAVAVDAEDESDLSLVGDVLRTAKAHGVKVILVANEISPMGLHQLMRMGADDFVPYPLPAGALREAVERIKEQAPPPVTLAEVPRALPAAAPAPELAAPAPSFKADSGRHGVLLPVHGMAGGAGASTFAANLAWELANADKTNPPRVCLLDLDFQFGSAATYLDFTRKENTFEVLTDPQAVDGDSLVKSMQVYGNKLHVFTAPVDMLPLDIIASDDLGRLIDMALNRFDFVVIDMPSTVVSWTEAVLTRAHIYFAMMELDLRSAQNVMRFVRALKAEALPHEKLRYVLNRGPKFTDLSAKSRVRRMSESLDISIEVQLPDGGSQVTQANDNGQPLAESAAKNPLRKEIQKLAKSLFDLSKAAETGRT